MLAPQLLDKVIDGHDTPRAGEQEGQDRAFLRSGDRQRIPAVRHDLERSEDEKAHSPDASALDRGWLAPFMALSFLFARDQGADRIACPDLIQFSQRERGVLRIIEAGVTGRVAGKQDADRVAGLGHAKRPQ
jgi:hypothetical protein